MRECCPPLHVRTGGDIIVSRPLIVNIDAIVMSSELQARTEGLVQQVWWLMLVHSDDGGGTNTQETPCKYRSP